MTSVIQNLKLEQIRIDGGTQPRTELNETAVAEYAEALIDGAKLPAVTVFYDGGFYWLADGFHRFFAHKKISALDIQAEVHQGTKRDAVLHSVGANASHGLRRTNADKRKAVETLLQDKEWASWSDREVARFCGVGNKFVGDIRRAICVPDTDAPATRTVERAGKAYEQNISNIGKSRRDREAEQCVQEKLREQKHLKKSRTLDSRPDDIPEASNADELADAAQIINELAEENTRLMDQIAIGQMEGSDIAKADAMEVIADLRGQVKTLEAENDALKSSRDSYMTENAEMKKTISYWRRQADKKVAA